MSPAIKGDQWPTWRVPRRPTAPWSDMLYDYAVLWYVYATWYNMIWSVLCHAMRDYTTLSSSRSLSISLDSPFLGEIFVYVTGVFFLIFFYSTIGVVTFRLRELLRCDCDISLDWPTRSLEGQHLMLTNQVSTGAFTGPTSKTQRKSGLKSIPWWASAAQPLISTSGPRGVFC